MPQVTEEYLAPVEASSASQPAGFEPPRERDVLNHANFGLLQTDDRRAGSFGISVGLNIAVAALILFLTLNKVHEVQVHRQEALVYVTPPPKPYIPPPVKIQMPPPPKLPPEPVKITPPKPVIEPPKPVVEPPKVAAKAPVIPAPTPAHVVTPPRPVLGAFHSVQAPAQQAQHLAPAEAAGFGAPTGVHPNPAANRSQLAAVGGFGAASNSNQGGARRLGEVSQTGFGSGAPSGTPNGSARGVIASTGFGSGSRAEGNPGGRGTVAQTGFGAGQPASSGYHPRTEEAAATTQVVVLSKPLPQYTEEARAARIQGDVTLEVRFTADGRVEVLRVVNGLGHGLDEQARVAAERIRFRPATRDGKPVDQVSIIRVTFQLA